MMDGPGGMMDGLCGSGAAMWGMGAIWLLVLLALVLGVAALVKYLFFGRPGRRGDG